MKGSPFTGLCRQLAVLRDRGRVDLHTHTTFSDGTHTPTSLVERAVQARLKAVAITDHDTTAAIEPARSVGAAIEVIAGVEVTAEWRGTELHLLGYFICPEDEALGSALREIRASRRERLLEMARRLKPRGVSAESELEAIPREVALGRRHLARLLVSHGHAGSLHAAFTRWLAAPEIAGVPLRRLSAPDAIALIHGAGGVTSWAHPPASLDLRLLEELRGLGLQAIECVYPWPSRAQETRLRQLAGAAGMVITGGSDSHDPSPATRAIGVRAVTLDDVARIRALARSSSAEPDVRPSLQPATR